MVPSYRWANGTATEAGAVTWGNGATGISGPISAANSLVGSSPYDRVGSSTLRLSSGHFVIRSPQWDDGLLPDVGAVTWVDGTSGAVGAVSAANSLIGSTPYDLVGSSSVVPLANGHFVVRSPLWRNGAVAGAGAVTWVDGTQPSTGTVSTLNSLVGSSENDNVGSAVTALRNGHYVLHTPDWDNDAIVDAGAVTWADGTGPSSGAVGPANSLVGSTAGDRVGSALSLLLNGHYVVRSPEWNNGALVDAGAVTWGDGQAGVVGTVSAANSLLGSSADDRLGEDYSNPPVLIPALEQLPNGGYVLTHPNWDDNGVVNVGAVTWSDGSAALTGSISASNSLVGSAAGDAIGSGGAEAFGDNAYIVRSPDHAGGAGAITLAPGDEPLLGVLDAANSVLGSAIGGGASMVADYDIALQRVAVGRPSDNRVTLRTLRRDATVVTLAASDSPSTVTSAVTFTATVSGAVPAGSVTFQADGVDIAGCTDVVLAGGGDAPTAACSTDALAVGLRSITAIYPGDAGNAPATGVLVHEVVRIAQIITFDAPADRAIAAPAFMLVASGGGSGNPVTFASLTDAVCVTSGSDGARVTLVGVGICTIRASQAGTAIHADATDVERSFAVLPAIELLGITAAPAVGDAISLVAVVRGASPGGTVAFRDGGVDIAGCDAVELVGTGDTRVASCTTPPLAAGLHALTAHYAGDATNAAVDSAVLPIDVRVDRIFADGFD